MLAIDVHSVAGRAEGDMGGGGVLLDARCSQAAPHIHWLEGIIRGGDVCEALR